MPQQALTIPETPTTDKPPVDTSNKHLDIDKIYYYRAVKGLSYQEIADLMGCVKTTIRYHCQQHNIKLPESSKHWNSKQEVKLQSKIDILLDSLTHDKAQKARVTEITTGYGTLMDKLRALQGYADMTIEVLTAKDYDKELDALDAEYRELSQGNNKE